MPWTKRDNPPSYENQPTKRRDKAIEIANKVLKTIGNEGEAIAPGLKQARAHFAKKKAKKLNEAIGNLLSIRDPQPGYHCSR